MIWLKLNPTLAKVINGGSKRGVEIFRNFFGEDPKNVG